MRETSRLVAPEAPGGRAQPLAVRAPQRVAYKSDTRPRRADVVESLVYCAAVLAIVVGWRIRAEQYYVAEKGLGYVLGIAGGAFMLALLAYPLRKRVTWKRLGSIKAWFRAHIVLGVLGPVLILFHSNFGLGSLNDNVALFSMLLVAASGLLGRHLYGRIHRGLSGRKATLAEVRKDMLDGAPHVGSGILAAVDERLRSMEHDVLRPPRGVIESATLPLRLAVQTRRQAFELKRVSKRSLAVAAARSPLVARHHCRLKRLAYSHIDGRVRRVRALAEFRFYERLFALWHAVHFPLFLVLVVAAAIHVIAVHFY